MSDSICPICLGQSFSDYRGRERAQCDSCDSLERHRSFRLFMLWIGPAYRNLIISTPDNPLKNIKLLDKMLAVEYLDEYEVRPEPKGQAHESIVFLENKIGFQHLEDTEEKNMKYLIANGSLVAFTCHSKSIGSHNDILTKLFSKKIECSHFNPFDVYGRAISEQCRLFMNVEKPGMNDIFYFTNAKEIRRENILQYANG